MWYYIHISHSLRINNKAYNRIKNRVDINSLRERSPKYTPYCIFIDIAFYATRMPRSKKSYEFIFSFNLKNGMSYYIQIQHNLRGSHKAYNRIKIIKVLVWLGSGHRSITHNLGAHWYCFLMMREWGFSNDLSF